MYIIYNVTYICACIFNTYIFTHNLSPPLGTLYKKSIISGGCRKEMLRAKQVGQVLRALVDFASKHAVFEAGNRNHRTEPPRQVWLDMGPRRAKNRSFFFSHICLFNDDLICIYFVDTKKTWGN